MKKQYKIVQATYCSPKCSYEGRTLGVTKRIVQKPYNCYRKKERMCIVCAKKYVYKKLTQKYCSKECCNIDYQVRYLGESNPAWVNGSSYNKKCL